MVVKLQEMNVPRYPLLNDAETRALIIKAQRGDQQAREKLINCNLKLVFNLVKRFQSRGFEVEDLFQIGSIGLMKAVDKFNLDYKVKFSTYAVPMIIGEIKRFLRDDNPVKISRSAKETAVQVHLLRERMLAQLNREPTVGEIAEALDIEREEVVLALEALKSPASIFDVVHQENGDPIYLLDQLKDEEKENAWLDHIAIDELLRTLPEREQYILRSRYLEDRTQAEVAARLGLSQVQVSRLERQALKKLRDTVGTNTPA